MSALDALLPLVRGQMVATDDAARRCARVDGAYSTPGVDGVYSTTARETRVDDASRGYRTAAGAQGVFPRSAVFARRWRVGDEGLTAQPPEGFSVIKCCGMSC